jgi:hypothetical protein
MSAAAPDLPNMVSAAPAASATPLKKRRGCGGFTSTTGAILLVFVVYVVCESLRVAHCRPLDSRDGLGMVSASSNRPAARAMACSSKCTHTCGREDRSSVAGTDDLTGARKAVYSRGEDLSADRERFI